MDLRDLTLKGPAKKKGRIYVRGSEQKKVVKYLARIELSAHVRTVNNNRIERARIRMIVCSALKGLAGS